MEYQNETNCFTTIEYVNLNCIPLHSLYEILIYIFFIIPILLFLYDLLLAEEVYQKIALCYVISNELLIHLPSKNIESSIKLWQIPFFWFHLHLAFLKESCKIEDIFFSWHRLDVVVLQ